MKKRVVGYIYCEKDLGPDEKAFLKEAKKRDLGIVFFNISKDFNEEDIEEKAKMCDIIFNNSAEEFSIEFVKTLEELGKIVVDSSKTYYFIEDKWMLYLECKKNKISTPNTILLSENINLAKKDLIKFNHWPVILKRIEGTCGNYVEKAENKQDAEKIIKKFWKMGSERIPIIAQEFIPSFSYRVTVIGGEIVQTAIKENHGWKCTGVYEKKFKKFEVDKELLKIVKKAINVTKVNACGIDFLKKEGKWVLLEVNSTPAFDFFQKERGFLIGKVLDLLKRKIKR
ncbi:MAG: ATP-grasp domain-containing protein [Candidatus Pacearchaeota archaeon]|jgi:RimK family alpha-L-glutamate ligase